MQWKKIASINTKADGGMQAKSGTADERRTSNVQHRILNEKNCINNELTRISTNQ